MQFSVVPYHPHQHRVVEQFVRHHVRTHYHLDWHPLAHWLRSSDGVSVVAYDSTAQLAGVLFTRSPLKGIAWLRLVALHDDAPPDVFQEMLDRLCVIGVEHGVQQIAVLETELWIQRFLQSGGFTKIDRIIHLKRDVDSASIPPVPSHIEIRQVRRRDLPAVEMVDHAAFAPYWQMTQDDLHEVMRHAAWFTVASIEGQIVGYQVSTTFANIVHLARLATLPTYQRQGVGGALVTSLITRFSGRPITVNTQHSNLASQRLYEKLGFHLQNWETPVWRLHIGKRTQ